MLLRCVFDIEMLVKLTKCIEIRFRGIHNRERDTLERLQSGVCGRVILNR